MFCSIATYQVYHQINVHQFAEIFLNWFESSVVVKTNTACRIDKINFFIYFSSFDKRREKTWTDISVSTLKRVSAARIINGKFPSYL